MIKKAQFSLGCFWHPDIYFSKLNGVIKTTVGYSGGSTPNPTYENMEGHTETILIEYNSGILSYQNLLSHFWKEHDPTIQQKIQYSSFVYFFDDKQKEIALQSLNEESKNII